MYLEDDDISAELFEHVVHDLNCEAQVQRVIDTDQALAFLKQEGEYSNARQPDVVVLDIHVPGGSAFCILQAIRSNDRLASLPVVMFGSSVASRDRIQAQSLGANELVLKSDFISAAQTALRLAA
jgi:CheY-like chemotaxis protein